jgi:DNA-binding MarR family transcriptional regulator
MSIQHDVPFETTLLVRDTCLCLHAQRAARTLARRFDDAMRPAGLTNRQFSLLMSLNRPQPPAMAPVAQLLGLDRTTLTAALKPLQRRGLVTVTADAADRRERRLHLTPAGKAVLQCAIPLWQQANTAAEALVPAGDAAGLRAVLSALG